MGLISQDLKKTKLMPDNNTTNIVEERKYEFTCPVCGGESLAYFIPGRFVCPVVSCEYLPEFKTIDTAIYDSSFGDFEAYEDDDAECVGCADCHYNRNHINDLLKEGCLRII